MIFFRLVDVPVLFVCFGMCVLSPNEQLTYHAPVISNPSSSTFYRFVYCTLFKVVCNGAKIFSDFIGSYIRQNKKHLNPLPE